MKQKNVPKNSSEFSGTFKKVFGKTHLTFPKDMFNLAKYHKSELIKEEERKPKDLSQVKLTTP